MELISVVVPVYNLQSCIGECIKSLQWQAYRNFEVLLVDDGSADDSLKICRKFAETDSRFRVFTQRNQGVSSARNLGISMAEGDFLCFVDGDDTVEPEYLEILHRQITKAEDVDLGLCGVDVAGTNTVVGGSRKLDGVWSQEQVVQGIFSTESVKGYLFNKIFRRSIISDNGLCLDRASHICEDALFCLEYALHIRRACFENLPLYHYIIRPGSATNRGFSAKLLSVVPTMDKIQRITKPLGNAQIDRRVEISKVIMNMLVFRSILKSKRTDCEKELTVTGRNLLPGYKHLLDGGFPLAEKVKYLQVLCYLVIHPALLKSITKKSA